jgi:hypothetical protein
MIAHVAAAGEQRGRVVLHLASGHPNRVALETALRIAKAFQSEVEGLFVEDQGLYACAGYPFAREISLCGRQRRQLSTETIERQLRHTASALGREIDALARTLEVPFRQTIVRDEPVAALARACTDCGPWNVVAIADTMTGSAGETVAHLFAAVTGTTGVVVAGARARRSTGSVVVVVDDLAELEPMLRAAERLKPEAAAGVTMLLVAETEDKVAWMDAQSRLVMGEATDVVIARAVVRPGAEAALAEVVRRLGGGLVIGRWGGVAAPSESELRHLVSNLECPLFLMR